MTFAYLLLIISVDTHVRECAIKNVEIVWNKFHVAIACSALISELICTLPCGKILSCGHACSKRYTNKCFHLILDVVRNVIPKNAKP
jgi:hypothetical protein